MAVEGGEQRSRRLFFALWPPAAVRTRLFGWAQSVHNATEGRLIEPANLHTTLAFLGMLGAARYDAAVALADCLHGEPFELVFDRIGHWPHNRIVYAAPGATPPALTELAVALARQLAGAGLRTEMRPYHAHVTLIRDARRTPPAERDFQPLCWPVDAFVLVESLREQTRLVYRPLRRWTLAG